MGHPSLYDMLPRMSLSWVLASKLLLLKGRGIPLWLGDEMDCCCSESGRCWSLVSWWLRIPESVPLHGLSLTSALILPKSVRPTGDHLDTRWQCEHYKYPRQIFTLIRVSTSAGKEGGIRFDNCRDHNHVRRAASRL